MTNYYGRRLEITIDRNVFIAETSGTPFKVSFNILVDFGGYNSYCDIKIYNLKDGSLGELLKKGNIISIKAGYSDATGYIFTGKINNTFKSRNGPDRVITILALGGSIGEKSINKSLGKGVNVTRVIRECVKATGYPLIIEEDDFSQESAYARGITLMGDPKKYLDNLAQVHNFDWTIENDVLICVKNGKSRLNIPPVLISEATGMEGVPEISEIGCDVRTRLNPNLRIGARIDIQSKLRTFNFNNLYFQDIPENAGTGVYKIYRISHIGDTWGNDWSSKIVSFRT